jgi:hypothetical protein
MTTARTAASRSSVGARASSPKRARRGRSRRGRSFLILAALAAALLAPSQAGAARSEFYGIAQGPKIDATDIQGMAGVKVHTVRFLVEWRYAEPSAGSFQWGGTDKEIGNLAARGIRAVPMVWGCPSWTGCSGPSRPPIGTTYAIQAWQTFLKALVDRYGPGGRYWSNGYLQQHPGATPLPVHSWQVWNEPNLTKYFDPGGTVGQAAQKYAKLVQYAHDAIKAKDAGAQVVLAGLLPNGNSLAWDFLNGLYGVSGFKNDFDVAALHPYAANLSEFTTDIQKFRNVMTSRSDGATPLWLTEFGWGSGTPDGWVNVGPTGQRDKLNGSFKLLLKNRAAWNIQRLFWFTWRDPAASSNYAHLCTFCGTAGLLNYNRTHKLAYDAFKAYTTETTKPTLSITSGPAPGSLINDSTPTFSFSVTDNYSGSTTVCRVGGGAYKRCASPYTLPKISDGSHTFYVKAIDAAGNESAVVSRSFTVDTKPPTITAPAQSFLVHTQISQSSLPVRVAWSGTDDRTAQSNLKFDLNKRTYQSGAWSAWSSVLANTSLRATVRYLPLGSQNQFEARSKDQAGNASAFNAGAGLTPTLLQQSAATYTAGGSWITQAQSDASGGSVKTSTKAGASASFAFTGASVGVVMPLRSTLGSVKICLDPGTASASCSTVDLSPASGLGARMIVFARSKLSAVQHHVKVTVLSGRADLDAFVTLR